MFLCPKDLPANFPDATPFSSVCFEKKTTKQHLDHLSFSTYGGKKNGIITYSPYIIWYDKTTGQKKKRKLGYIYSIMSTVT